MEYPELLKSTKTIPLVMKTKNGDKFDYRNSGYLKIGGGIAHGITATYGKHPDSSDGCNLILEIFNEHSNNS